MKSGAKVAIICKLAKLFLKLIHKMLNINAVLFIIRMPGTEQKDPCSMSGIHFFYHLGLTCQWMSKGTANSLRC